MTIKLTSIARLFSCRRQTTPLVLSSRTRTLSILSLSKDEGRWFCVSKHVALAALITTILCALSIAALAANDPYIGYVYPAGGQKGTTLQVTVSGQRLSTARSAWFTGKGITATVAGYVGAGGALNKLQQEELKRRLQEIRDQRLGRLPGAKRKEADPQTKPNKAANKTSAAADGQPVALPDLPELRNLEQKSAQDLIDIANKFINPQKRPKPPIAEQVTLDVTIDPAVKPGDYEIRLRTAAGLSNPLVFQVGDIPEVRGGGVYEKPVATPPAAPAVFNGQIMPGDVDRFPLRLKSGQKLIVAAQGRKLIPYLADAVPGWFQAVVALYDPAGRQVAYGDDCGFVPDPAFTFEVPADGQYTLEVRDAIYRGREDFVYRVAVADVAMAKTLLPLGSRGGVPIGDLKLNSQLCLKLAQDHFDLAHNQIPVSAEREPNETGQTSMNAALPAIISGSISKPGDKDVLRIEGKAGDRIIVEVFARRMGSALDSLVRLIGTDGKVVAWNDDCPDQTQGLFTHHADSCLSAKLPKTGKFFVQISDAQRHGGPEHTYYLRVSPPQPDFALHIAPSCLNVQAGRAAVATVYASRKDGWDGEITLALKGAPRGCTLSGGVIPKGRDKVRVTVTAPRTAPNQPFALALEGAAQIGSRTLTRTAVPAEDREQAFAYHHLVPSQQMLMCVGRGFGATPAADLPAGERLKITPGGSAEVSFTAPAALSSAPIELELSNPPPGVTLRNVRKSQGRYTLTFAADDKSAGCADNLIVEAFTEVKRGGTATAQKQRVSVGFLPAIPFEIVKR